MRSPGFKMTSTTTTPVMGPMPAPSGSRGTSPIPTISVPLITPRYQRKTRTKNAMEVTDSTSSEENTFSATELLRQRSVEALNIRHGCATYGEHVRFHAYALYRHGSRAIVTQSVGYSSDGDLVLQRQDVSESDSDMIAHRVRSEVGGAVCLDPTARRPLTDTEAASSKKINASKLKKYPGVKCPKNRKIRNRLRNDHFANPFAREVYNAVCEDSGTDEGEMQARPVFAQAPSTLTSLLHKDEDVQMAALERKGVSPLLRPSAAPAEADPNSPEARFLLLSAKLRDELKRALGSEVLTALIVELEKRFAAFITRSGGSSRAASNPEADGDDRKPLTIEGLDGYGRLICHGVAAFYKLNSQSADADNGERVTQVTMPKKAANVQLPTSTLLEFMKRRTGGSGGNTALLPPSLTLDSGSAAAIYEHKKTRKGGKRGTK